MVFRNKKVLLILGCVKCPPYNLFKLVLDPPFYIACIVAANESRNEHLCSFYDEEDCLYVYVYSYNDAQHLIIRAREERECPKKVC